jgi:hypothetical protein
MSGFLIAQRTFLKLSDTARIEKTHKIDQISQTLQNSLSHTHTVTHTHTHTHTQVGTHTLYIYVGHIRTRSLTYSYTL